MTTPVLFLDDASRHMGAVDRAQAERTAKALIDTLKSIRKINKKFALNTALPIAQYQIADNWTLQSILGGPSFEVEWAFIRLLSDHSPFADGFEGLLEEVSGMEFRTQPNQIPSNALAWATLLDSATVSFAAHADWSSAWVDTAYSVLEDDGNISNTEGRIRNASHSAHTDEHAEWLQQLGLSETPTASQVWSEREQRFPGLRFLPRVEKDIEALASSGAPYLQALSALKALASDIANWKSNDVAWPEFSTKASPEHSNRQMFCLVLDEITGQKESFDWHTRFTGGLAGRVHFRVDCTSRSIVVAYVGAKLSREIAG